MRATTIRSRTLSGTSHEESVWHLRGERAKRLVGSVAIMIFVRIPDYAAPRGELQFRSRLGAGGISPQPGEDDVHPFARACSNGKRRTARGAGSEAGRSGFGSPVHNGAAHSRPCHTCHVFFWVAFGGDSSSLHSSPAKATLQGTLGHFQRRYFCACFAGFKGATSFSGRRRVHIGRCRAVVAFDVCGVAGLKG